MLFLAGAGLPKGASGSEKAKVPAKSMLIKPKISDEPPQMSTSMQGRKAGSPKVSEPIRQPVAEPISKMAAKTVASPVGSGTKARVRPVLEQVSPVAAKPAVSVPKAQKRELGATAKPSTRSEDKPTASTVSSASGPWVQKAREVSPEVSKFCKLTLLFSVICI